MEKIKTEQRSLGSALLSVGWRTLQRLTRQLVSSVGSLVVMALLLFAYHAWAAPSAELSTAAPAWDVSPGLLSYQGYLTDANGGPLNGDVDITFRLYGAPTGGTALWEEAHTGGNAVPVNDGLFNVMLGSLTPLPDDLDVGECYLGVQVAGDNEMTPREMAGTVIMAMTAGRAMTAMTVPDKSITSDKIADGAVTASKVTLPHGYVVGDAGKFNLNTTKRTVPGLSFSVNSTTHQVLHLTITLDATKASASGPIVGCVFVDGSWKGRPVVLAGNIRASVSTSIQVDLSPGSHTIDFKAWLESGSGSFLYSENSVMTYIMFAQ